MVTAEQLMLIAPRCPVNRVHDLAEALTWALERFEITNLVEVAAFIGQAALETWHFRHFKELRPRGQPNYFDQYGYNTRKGRNLGNTQPSDGARFCGHGIGMVTGRRNTTDFWKWLVSNFNEWREVLLEEVTYLMEHDRHVAVLTAIWYWTEYGCGEQSQIMKFGSVPWRRDVTPADCASLGFKQVTKTINGGLNHYWLRIVFFMRALQALGVEVDLDD